MAALFLRKGADQAAMRALQECVKFKRDSWQARRRRSAHSGRVLLLAAAAALHCTALPAH